MREVGPLLGWILLAALLLRLFVVFVAGFDWVTPDTAVYFRMADRILAGDPEGHFPNGYPLLVAAAKLLFPSARVEAVLLALNAILSTAMVALAHGIARSLGSGERGALGAAVILAFLPNQLVYVHYLLSDVSAAFLLACGMLALCRRHFVTGAACLAAAALFRSTLTPALLGVFALVALRSDARPGFARLVAGAAGVGAAYAILLLAGVVEPSRNLGSNLLLAVSDTSSGFGWSKEMFSEADRAAPMQTYLRFAAEHPIEFVHQRASSLWELWGPYPLDVPRPAWENLLLGLRFPLLLLGALAAVSGRRRFEFQLLAIPVVTITLVHVAFFSTPRFAFVVMPLVVAAAATELTRRGGRWVRPET